MKLFQDIELKKLENLEADFYNFEVVPMMALKKFKKLQPKFHRMTRDVVSIPTAKLVPSAEIPEKETAIPLAIEAPMTMEILIKIIIEDRRVPLPLNRKLLERIRYLRKHDTIQERIEAARIPQTIWEMY